MKTLLEKFRTALPVRAAVLAGLIATIAFVSCKKDDAPEAPNGSSFEASVMPVPKEITYGETVELRISLKPAAGQGNTQYFIRYFQFDGVGALAYYGQPPLQPNDLYPLPAHEFRLYYTSRSAVKQSFDVWISDDFGNEKQLRFEFESRNRLGGAD